MNEVVWRIDREGRTWTATETQARLSLLPDRLEIIEGRLLWSEEERINLLAMLLENVGTQKLQELVPRIKELE